MLRVEGWRMERGRRLSIGGDCGGRGVGERG